MTVGELVTLVGGTLLAGATGTGREVRGGYASDLLSDVMAHSREGDAWITLQRHVNVVAVAQLKGLAVILLINGRGAEPDTAARADDEAIPVVSTPLSAFDAIGVLYGAGIRGGRTS